MKELLIQSIKFDKEFDDLTLTQKADFLKLIGIHFLAESNRKRIVKKYNQYRDTVEYAGLEKLHLYV